jgi:hypothetical protein
MEKLKIAFSYMEYNNLFDPSEVNDANQAILIENIFGKLIYFNEKGEYIPDLSSRYYIENDELRFEFDGKSKTSKGKVIKPSDFERSFKRSMILSKNTHANLKEYICYEDNLKNLDDKCSGIYSTENELVFKLKNKSYLPLVLQVLASVDFVLLPPNIYEESYPFKIKINELDDTSGPYFISHFENNNQKISITLQSNKSNRFIDDSSFEKIELIDIADQSLEDFIFNNKINAIPTNISVSQSLYEKIKNKWNIDFTNPILTGYLRVSNEALKKFSLSEIFYLAEKIKSKMFEKYPLPIGANETYQYFQESGAENIDTNGLENYKNLRKKIKKPEKQAIFLAYDDLRSRFEIFEEIPDLSIKWINYSPITKDETKWGDMHLLYVDSAFHEDITLINYDFSSGTFDYSDKKAKMWRKRFIEMASFEERKKMVNELQFEMLKKGKVIPLFVSPYSILATKNIKININKHLASTYFWNFKKS